MKVKNFSLSSTSGNDFVLKDQEAKGIVLYFYPKDNTSGCTKEGEDFAKRYKQFTKLGFEVFGISRDSIESHQKFRTKMKFPFHLLSDKEELACNIFDVIKMKNMYGKKVRGIERSTFIVAKNGAIIKEWRKIKVEGHAEEVFNFVKNID